jgi:hypothetical protein
MVAGCCAAALPLALLVPGLRPRDWLLRDYRSQLMNASPEQRRVVLREIAEHHDMDGLPLMVQVMCNGDDTAGATAHAILCGLLLRWESWPLEKATPRYARLAELLAKQHPAKGRRAHQRRHELAARLLLCRAVQAASNATQIMLHCEHVLRQPLPAGSDIADLRDAPADEAITYEIANLADNRGAVGTPEPVPIDAPPRLSATDCTEAPALQPAIAGARPNLEPEPEGSNRAFRDRADAPASPHSAIVEPMPLPVMERRWIELGDREVIDELTGPDAAQAFAELQRRGYNAQHLELARLVVHPDRAQRLAMIDVLLQLASVDPRPWLIWLTRDEDPAVRKAAIAVIATSNDPQLRAQLQQVERDETDPEILRFVRRINR